MPRRREVPKRIVLPDPKYNDVVVSKFMNSVMKQGKKSTAEGIVYGAFDTIYERTKDCLLYTSPSPRDVEESRMPSSA